MKKYVILAQIAALICTIASSIKAGASVLNVAAIILLAISLTLNLREGVK